MGLHTFGGSPADILTNAAGDVVALYAGGPNVGQPIRLSVWADAERTQAVTNLFSVNDAVLPGYVTPETNPVSPNFGRVVFKASDIYAALWVWDGNPDADPWLVWARETPRSLGDVLASVGTMEQLRDQAAAAAAAAADAAGAGTEAREIAQEAQTAAAAAQTAAASAQTQAAGASSAVASLSGTVSGKVGQAALAGYLRSGTNNVILGTGAGEEVNESASDNNAAGGYRIVAVGARALEKNDRGWKNTAVGTDAMRDNIDGYNNVAVGDSALERLVGGIGSSASSPEDPGARNVAVGSYAGRYMSSGRANVFMGRNAGHTVTTGAYNTAVGTNAMSGSYSESGQQDVKTLSYAVCMGYNAGFNLNQDGHVALGTHALYYLESGTGNPCVAVGREALYNAVNNANTALGYRAGYGITTGRFNLALGPSILTGPDITGGRNIGIGSSSLASLTGGTSNNVAVGCEALNNIVSGSGNTAIGDGAMFGRTTDANSSALGRNATTTGSNQVQLGDSATTAYSYGAVQSRSDARDKADIADTPLGLEFIEALRPRQFRWDYREDYPDGQPDGSLKRSRFHQGLIAQEVAGVCDQLGVDFGGLQHHAKAGGDDVYSIGYEELVAPLIAAVQQLAERVRQLESR